MQQFDTKMFWTLVFLKILATNIDHESSAHQTICYLFLLADLNRHTHTQNQSPIVHLDFEVGIVLGPG